MFHSDVFGRKDSLVSVCWQSQSLLVQNLETGFILKSQKTSCIYLYNMSAVEYYISAVEYYATFISFWRRGSY